MEYRICEIGEVVGGGTPSTKRNEYWNGCIPWISPKDLTSHTSVYISHGKKFITKEGLKAGSTLLPQNTVLMSSRAPIGYLAIAENELCTNQGFKSIVCNEEKVVPLYLYYYLKANIEYIRLFGTGATFPEISAKTLRKIKINIEESTEKQNRVATVLSNYDNLIENNNKRIKLLEQMAENLYKEWFVRFRFPGYENTKFIDGIPSDWNILRMSDFCYVTDGTHDTPKPVNDGGVPLVTGKCIKNGFIDFNESYNISYQDHESISRRSGLQTGDILFSNIGTVGTTCLVNYYREFSVKNVIIFKPGNIKVSNYLYSWLNSTSIQAIFATQTNGASQQFVGLNFMRRFKILVPNENVIGLYSDRIKPIRTEIVKLHDINENLIQQRYLLLPRLMSGKLEV